MAEEHPFSGDCSFFSDIRDSRQWREQKGSFFGYDPEYAMHYVIMDATFYKLGIFDRCPPNRSHPGVFSEVLEGQMRSNPRIKVMTNGQFFADTSMHEPFGGQIINGVHHRYDSGNEDYNGWLTFAQNSYRGEVSYSVVQGRPRDFRWEYNALGGLGHMIKNSRANTERTRWASPSDYLPSYDYSKIILGIHRSSNCIFVIGEDLESSDITFEALQSRLIEMCVDDAVILDGASSATMVVRDHTGPTTLIETAIFNQIGTLGRAHHIPNGTYFEYQEMSFWARDSSIKWNTQLTTDETIGARDTVFFQEFRRREFIFGIGGKLQPSTSGEGLELVLYHLGSITAEDAPDGTTRNLHDILGLSIPLVLVSNSHNIQEMSTFTAPGMEGIFHYDIYQGTPILKGSLAILTNGTSALVLDFNILVD